ncbi:MAG: sigma 54-interacting transcriptional regulator [Clostridium celatum]|uniref:sigma-54 interaction domain-containing protein n=1 Tax=Clostridium sp. TaxID=1506 RepID=UPI0025BBD100|nr:sigma 54-interacting transcriptional regulator [Clostridium sp.]MBS4956272.1 sigma 54-interacting transcriptional regulator [Clostridium sp.]MDU2122242.1 sigma 54-interacting transcriptional regulator [Clostridium celatum]MDU4978183.1 sigma 54-interacting transcriptional regulator [Clostridium celatum]
MRLVRLNDIREYLQSYANAISNILKIDVEIVDENLNRIIGTGFYEEKIGVNIKKNGLVYSETLRTRKMQVIENPGKNKLCKKCIDKDNCFEKMEISYPIYYGEDTFGVIGLVCTSNEQKQILVDNFKNIMSFIEHMSELIAAKIIEQNEEIIQRKNLIFLKQIINSVNDGVIIIKNNNIISSINLKGVKELALNSNIVGESIKVELTDDYFQESQIYNVEIDGKKYEVVGKLIPSSTNLEDYNSVLIFNKLKKIKEEAITLTYGINKTNIFSILGDSKKMMLLKSKIRKISNSSSTVLITGESGTGKELVARAIHYEGNRKNKPFIAINCGAIPETLLESELFGYDKGAFSGANSNGRMGKFELANKGVIFLDEIGDMPLYLQVKLLRVLQEKTIVRIGSNKLVSLDLRVIAATNKDLKELVRRGKFREDLYYRLNVIPIEIPPLRERKGDLELLLNSLIDKYNIEFNKSVYLIEDNVLEMFRKYKWCGNIRELENVVEFMVSLCDEKGIINETMLPDSFIESFHEQMGLEEKGNDDIKEIIPLKDIEKKYIKKAIEIYGDTTEGKKIAAKKLGIGIATLYRRLEQE